jgi:hypothetical protein
MHITTDMAEGSTRSGRRCSSGRGGGRREGGLHSRRGGRSGVRGGGGGVVGRGVDGRVRSSRREGLDGLREAQAVQGHYNGATKTDVVLKRVADVRDLCASERVL